MEGKIEILTQTQGTLPRFTVDTTATHVYLVYPSTDLLTNAFGKSVFAQGDSFRILTAGLMLPLSFQLYAEYTASVTPWIKANFYGTGVTTTKNYYFKELSSFGGTGRLLYPMENYEIPIDTFINIQDQAANTGSYIKDEAFTLHSIIDVTSCSISMIGVPAALHSLVFMATPFIKVAHNFELT